MMLLCLAAGRLLRAQRPRLARVLFRVGLGLVVVAVIPGPGELLLWSLRGALWQPGSKVDAIVVLGADQLDDGSPGPESLARLAYGVKLFRAGAAPVLVSSTGSIGHTLTLGEGMSRLAVTMGVPEAAVLTEGRSRDTHENAVETGKVLLPRGLRRIALVSGPTHMRRASAAFRKTGFLVVPAPAWANQEIQIGFPTFSRALTVERAVREWLGIAWYTGRGWM